MSVSTSVVVDTVAVTNEAIVKPAVAALLARINDMVNVADDTYTYRGAARVGLNRLLSSARTHTAADYAPQVGITSTITLSAEDDDDARAQGIATAYGITKARVLSKAVCTGLMLLTGHDSESGPFV